jgi:hypothetical protein
MSFCKRLLTFFSLDEFGVSQDVVTELLVEICIYATEVSSKTE